MRTPYDRKNGHFSNEAHEAAKDLIYPRLFGVEKEQLEFVPTLVGTGARNDLLDGEMAVDRLISAHIGLRQPLQFFIQERFRRENKAHYQDLTITEWNHNSNLASELYKIKASLFVYGYYSQIEANFIDAIAIVVPTLLMKICAKEIVYTKEHNPRSNQSFVCFTFENLERAGVVLWRLPKYEQIDITGNSY